jgi:hypothetical protein
VLDLLRGGVDLLLALLAATTQAQYQVEGRLLLDVVVREGATVLKLLAGEDETLLVWGDSFLVCVAPGMVSITSAMKRTAAGGQNVP